MRAWTDTELDHFQTHGYVARTDALDPEGVAALRAWVDELAARPEAPGRWMKWFEGEGASRVLCRMEDFLPYHAELDALCTGPGMRSALTPLLGDAPALFKEKINFKLPGGGAYAPHQDAPAFASFGQRYHITVMIAVDEASERNGGLEFAPNVDEGTLLPQAADGTVAPATADTLPWHHVGLPAGGMLFFHSYVPHRSPPNRSDAPRRALFVTWNRAAEGERRADYFAKKRADFPPECEREPGRDYSAGAATFNLGNPIR